MKTHPFRSLIVLILFLQTLVGLQAEVITINFQTVFEEYYELKVEDQKLREEVSEFQQAQQEKVQALQAQQQAFNELRTRAAQPDVSDAERKQMVEEATKQLEALNQEEQALRQEQAKFQKDLEAKGMRLRRGIVDKINEKVAEIAERQGWEIVLDSSATSPNGLPVISYSITSLDKTGLVIQELNAAARSAAASAE